MAELMAKSACDGLLPVSAGTVSLSEIDLGVLTSLASHKRGGKALRAALRSSHGMAFPAANRATGKEGERAIWFGHAHVLLAGPVPDPSLAKHATITDQSDAWAAVRLEGADAADVLARLCPVDMRVSVFKRGHTAKTLLQHMSVSVTRLGNDAFLLLAFRSMAGTLVHELETAMRGVAARAGG